MAWVKSSDTVAMDERLLTVAELVDADERSVNEVWGFVNRLYTQAAQAGSDYVVSMGTAMVLSSRYEVLLDQAARAGMVTLEEIDGRRKVRLVADGEFIHLRPREEQAWEAARRADASEKTLVVPVRLRDGDACRYCGKVVQWGDQKGNRGATYDHLRPGQRAESFHELVVACRACNGGRRDAGESRDAAFPLMPAPSESARYFSRSTLTWLEKHGSIIVQLGLELPKRPRGARDKAPGAYARPDVPPTSRGTTTTEAAGPAAPPQGGEQRPAAPRTRPGPAAPPTSGEQRPGTATGSSSADPDGREVPAGAPDRPAPAAPHPSGEQRADHEPGALDADQPPAEVVSQVEQKQPPTWANGEVQSDPDPEAARSGFSGSGRDGSGRVGPERDGTGRAGTGAAQRPPVVKRKKRGRRRKGSR